MNARTELSHLLAALRKSGAWPYLPVAQSAEQSASDASALLSDVKAEAWAFQDRLGYPLRQLPEIAP